MDTTVDSQGPIGSGRSASKVAWTRQVLGAAAFLAAGTAKLAGTPMMVETFDHIGIGQWFRIVTGLVEIAGGVLLLVPRLSPIGGLLLAATMACAIATHLLIIGGNPAPAITLFAITAGVVWLRRDRLRALLS